MNKKSKIIEWISIGLLLVMLVVATYAYLESFVGNTVFGNINLHTFTDTLSFRTSDDISLTVEADAFLSEGSNAATSTGYVEAILSGNTSGSYYAYMHIIENGIDYSDKINNTPELLLTITYQVDDGTPVAVTSGVTVDGVDLSYTTQKGVSGFDITGLGKSEEALISIRNPNSIGLNGSETQKYNITITLINHDFNQNRNTGQSFIAELIIDNAEEYLSSKITLSSENTNCTNIKCALDELYRIYEGEE